MRVMTDTGKIGEVVQDKLTGIASHGAYVRFSEIDAVYFWPWDKLTKLDDQADAERAADLKGA